jgi:uncharacterized protein with PIN domain
MLFITDGMLGKLSRWLRLLGQDVIYCKSEADEGILQKARAEDRTLLSRDIELVRLANSRGVNAFYVDATDLSRQLALVCSRFNVSPSPLSASSRCTICNSQVRLVAPSEVENKVLKNVLRAFSEFWICDRCGRVYWRGSHWKRINQTLEMVRKTMPPSRSAR